MWNNITPLVSINTTLYYKMYVYIYHEEYQLIQTQYALDPKV